MAYKKKVVEPKVEQEVLLGIEVDGKEAVVIKTSKKTYRYEVKHHGADRWIVKA